MPPSKRNDLAVRGLLALAMVAYIFVARTVYAAADGTNTYPLSTTFSGTYETNQTGGAGIGPYLGTIVLHNNGTDSWTPGSISGSGPDPTWANGNGVMQVTQADAASHGSAISAGGTASISAGIRFMLPWFGSGQSVSSRTAVVGWSTAGATDTVYLSVDIAATLYMAGNGASLSFSGPGNAGTFSGWTVHLYRNSPGVREGIDPPAMAEGELSLSEFASIDFEIKVDSDDDGIPDLVVETGTIMDGEGWSFEAADGVAWEVRAVSGNIATDGPERKIPLDRVIGSGEGSTETPVEVTMSGTTFSPIEHVSVSGGGAVSRTPIYQGQATVNGATSTYYTYENSAGGMTSVIYSGTGSSTVTNKDVERASVQNSAENERMIKAINQLQTAVEVSGSNTVSAVSGTGTPSPTPLPDGEDIGEGALAGIPSAPDLSAVVSGTATNADLPSYDGESSDFWVINLPAWIGAEDNKIDLNPLSVPLIVTVANWFRVLYVLFMTYVVIATNYKNSESCLIVINTAQPGSSLGAVATEVSGWLGTVVMVAIAVAVRLLIMAFLPSVFTIFAGYSEIEGNGAVTGLWFLGGKDIISNIGTHIAGASSIPALQAALELFDAFFPIEFMLVAAANILGYFVLTLFVALAYGTWVKFFPR